MLTSKVGNKAVTSLHGTKARTERVLGRQAADFRQEPVREHSLPGSADAEVTLDPTP